jgi:hypothetical protein
VRDFRVDDFECAAIQKVLRTEPFSACANIHWDPLLPLTSLSKLRLIFYFVKSLNRWLENKQGIFVAGGDLTKFADFQEVKSGGSFSYCDPLAVDLE